MAEIGKKGIELERKWIQALNKKKQSKVKLELENTYINSDLNDLENLVIKEKENTLKLNRVWLQDSVLHLLLKVFRTYYHN